MSNLVRPLNELLSVVLVPIHGKIKDVAVFLFGARAFARRGTRASSAATSSDRGTTSCNWNRSHGASATAIPTTGRFASATGRLASRARRSSSATRLGTTR